MQAVLDRRLGFRRASPEDIDSISARIRRGVTLFFVGGRRKRAGDRLIVLCTDAAARFVADADTLTVGIVFHFVVVAQVRSGRLVRARSREAWVFRFAALLRGDRLRELSDTERIGAGLGRNVSEGTRDELAVEFRGKRPAIVWRGLVGCKPRFATDRRGAGRQKCPSVLFGGGAFGIALQRIRRAPHFAGDLFHFTARIVGRGAGHRICRAVARLRQQVLRLPMARLGQRVVVDVRRIRRERIAVHVGDAELRGILAHPVGQVQRQPLLKGRHRFGPRTLKGVGRRRLPEVLGGRFSVFRPFSLEVGRIAATDSRQESDGERETDEPSERGHMFRNHHGRGVVIS